MAHHDIVALENHVLKAWIDKATSCYQKATLMISLGTLDQNLWQFKEPSSKTLSACPEMVARLDFKSRQATISKQANPTISQLPVISFGLLYAQMKAPDEENPSKVFLDDQLRQTAKFKSGRKNMTRISQLWFKLLA
ncbi:hypothetical protein DSO57_1039812 [Entomophthora muscae]|uniref:Uncharacterized protein n=1 Tax=Entomophthora muscae TaxID=34485 RepID=A0ACC2UEA7_9FUNG|nr:hypothetical protein DSO57_1039812 [Entomophthora muscae]